MTFARLKKVNVRIWSVILSVAILATSFIGLKVNIDVHAADAVKTLASFTDDFDRTTITGESSGWVEQIAGAQGSRIENGVLLLTETGTNIGHYKNLIMRPLSEAAVNQKVSVEVNNLADHFVTAHTVASANVHARVQATGNTYATSYYAAAQDGFLKIGKTVSADGNAEPARTVIAQHAGLNLATSKTYRIELTVEGVYPTTLTAILYNVTTDTVEATVTATDSDVALQGAGTVGLSVTNNNASTQRTAKMDNFVYNELPLVSYADNFQRDTITGSGSGWIEQIAGAQGSRIENGELLLTETGTNIGHYKNLIMRPLTEAALNQKVSVEVNNLADHFVTSHTVASANVHVRVQGTEDKYATGYYAAAQDGFLKIGKTVSADGNTEPAKTILAQKTDLNLATGRKYRITLSAEGVYPTTLTATLYNVTDNVEVATLTVTDSEAALQGVGTVGLSVTNNNASTQRTAKMDTFIYNEIKETTSGLKEFADGFERNTITGNNSRWVEQIVGAQGSVIDGGILKLTETGTNIGHYKNLIMRPMTEAAVDQKVSVEVKNLADHFVTSHTVASANVHVRVQNTNVKYTTSYYAAAQDGFLKIGKTVSSDGNTEPAKAIIVQKTDLNLATGRTYRIELSAVGTNPTTLTATLYNVTDNVEIATITATDSDEALQGAGTVGLSVTNNNASTQRTATMDNFLYKELGQDIDDDDDNNDDDDDDDDDDDQPIIDEPYEVPYSYTDDFNRDAIAGNNSGWIEKRTENSQNKIVGGVLELTDPSTNGNYGHVSDIVMRPMSEAALNQKVSVDVLNRGELSNYASANVHIRVVPKDNVYIGYFASLNNNTLQIRRTTSTGATVLTGGEKKAEVKFVSGHTYRLELEAQGVNPTVLKATVYDVTDNNKVVATLLGNDNTADLQVSGTVALSGTSNKVTPRNIAKMDNFAYTQTDTLKYSDSFGTKELDSSWVMSDASKAAPTLSGGGLVPGRTAAGNFSGKAILRPKATEAALNQLVEIDFERIDAEAHTFGPSVLTRVQDASNLQYTGDYYQVVVELARGGKNNSSARMQIIRSGAQNLTVGGKPTATFNTDPSLKYRLQVSVTSNEEGTTTTIVATLYKVNANGTLTKTAQVTGTDSTAALQTAGTVALTYLNGIESTSLNSGISIDNFGYFEQPEKPQIPLSEDPKVPYVFEDNFNRANGDINSNNGWIDQYNTVSGGVIGTINNNRLVLQNASNFSETNSFVYGRILRPMTEASTDQRVSIDILNLKDIESAELQLRTTRLASTEDEVKKDHCFYLVRLSKEDLTIRTQMSFVTGRFAGVPFKYEEGHTYRLEATAYSSKPTVIVASVYDVTDNNKLVATVTGTDESLVASNGRTGQITGTVGVAYIGTAPAVFDNFKYEHIGNFINYDIFNRKDGAVGNDWINASANNGNPSITNEKLVLNNNGTDGMWNALMLRPDSEAILNQSVKVVFTNASMPQGTGPAPVLFARVKDNSNGGYIAYGARINYKGADTTVTIFKVMPDGTSQVISEGKPMNNIHTNFGNSTQPIHFEFRAEGSSPTKLTVILYKLNDGEKETFYYNTTVYDSQTELQSAGTAGVSYGGATIPFDIDTFIYTEVPALPQVATGPAKVSGDYMLYFYGTVSSGNFGQWVELEPEKTYTYTVRLKTTFNSGGFAPKLRYEKKAEGRVVRDFAATATTMDENTFYYTLTFSVPEDAHIQQNGKARIFIGIHEGGLGSMGYATDFKLTERGSKTNLLVNADFAQGFFKWSSQSIMIQGVQTNDYVTLIPSSEEVELLKYDPLVFMRDDSDVYFDDGDWAKDYTSADGTVKYGAIIGNLTDVNGNAIKGATLILTPGDITVTTDDKGNFEFRNLKEGTYKLALKTEDGTLCAFNEELNVTADGCLELNLTFDAEKLTLSQTTASWIIWVVVAAVVLAAAGVVVFILLKKKAKKA